MYSDELIPTRTNKDSTQCRKLFYPLQGLCFECHKSASLVLVWNWKMKCITTELKIVICVNLMKWKVTWAKDHVDKQGPMSPHELTQEMKIPWKKGHWIRLSLQHTRCPCPRVHNLSWKFQQTASEEIFRYLWDWDNLVLHNPVSNLNKLKKFKRD